MRWQRSELTRGESLILPRGMVVLGLVLGVIVAASWTSNWLARSKTAVEEFTLVTEPVPQAAHGRAWRSSPSIVSWTEDERILQTADVAVHGGGLFVLDWRDQAVKRFSLSGKITSLARMESDKFSQNAYPSDFDISPSGELYLAYPKLLSVRVFGENGKLLRSLLLPKAPHRVALLSDSEFVVMTGRPDSFLFHRFSVDGQLLSSFGRLVDGIQHPLPLDGWIASDAQGGLIFASFHSGLLARFDATTGNRRFLVEGIRRGPLPSVMVGSSGRRRVKPGSPFYSLAVSVDGNEIYVLSDRDRLHGQRTLDVYDLSDGRYLWSTRLHEPLSHAVVRGGLLFGGTRSRLSIWRLPQAS